MELGTLPISSTFCKVAMLSTEGMAQPAGRGLAPGRGRRWRVLEGCASSINVPAAVRAQRCEPVLKALSLREDLAPCDWCGSCHTCECRNFLEAMFEDAQPRDVKGVLTKDTASDIPSTAATSEASEISETSSCGGVEDLDPGSDIASPPDFSGRWTLKGIEGDFEELMLDAGVGWAMRKVARGANYGIGMVEQIIEHNADGLSIESKQGPGSTRYINFNIDVGEQRTIGENGASIVVTPRWEGQTLVVEGHFASGARIQKMKRYFDGPEMVIESITSQGLVAKRFFSKQQ